MKNIPLRVYVRDIENLITKGKPAYAEQHCKHILRAFPKHVELYRLLGNACLDMEKIDEAGDVFQRLLSVIPDDFTALVGLAVVKEDQNDLDSAIWYMERAGEVDPSNTEVQAETRRLFTKRDGAAPDHTRTTSGSLIRMYLKANLFDQAISKARSALAEDPQQVDIQLLLARTYYHLGKKMEAAELCIQIVNMLPYCQEANKILFIICSTMNRVAEANVFQQRINEIDPYAALISPEYPSATQVPDETIMLERLDVPLKEDELYIRQSEEPAAELMKILYAPADSSISEETIQPQNDFDEVKTAPSESSQDDLRMSLLDTLDTSSPESEPDLENIPETDQNPQSENSFGDPLTESESLYREEDLPDWLRNFSKPAESSVKDNQTENVIANRFQGAAESENKIQEGSADFHSVSPVNEQEQVLAWLKNLEESDQKTIDPILMTEFPSLNFGQVEPSVEKSDEIVSPFEFSPSPEEKMEDLGDLQSQLRSILMQDAGDAADDGDNNHPWGDVPQDASGNPGDTIEPESK